jgi:hypothetical protein
VAEEEHMNRRFFMAIAIAISLAGCSAGAASLEQATPTPASTLVPTPTPLVIYVTPAPADKPDVTATPLAATPAPAPTATPVPVAKVLFTMKGSGIKSTKPIAIPDADLSVQLDYSYTCKAFGMAGNFQVYWYEPDGTLGDISVN